MAILLPSGVLWGQFFGHEAHSRCALKVSMTWSRSVVTTWLVHFNWLHFKNFSRIENYYPKSAKRERGPKSSKSQTTINIKFKAINSLSNQMQTHMSEKFILGISESNAMIVSEKLRGQEDL